MSTPIERFLYRQFGTHGITDLRFELGTISLVIAPLTDCAPFIDIKNGLSVRFDNFKLKNIDTAFAGDEDWPMPWAIIGFDCTPNGAQWDFCFHSDAIEVSFVSDWPIVAPKAS